MVVSSLCQLTVIFLDGGGLRARVSSVMGLSGTLNVWHVVMLGYDHSLRWRRVNDNDNTNDTGVVTFPGGILNATRTSMLQCGNT